MNALAAEQALLHSRSDGIADAWRASWLSRLTWSYMTPLLRLGYKRALEMDDVGDLDFSDRAGPLADALLADVKRQGAAQSRPSTPASRATATHHAQGQAKNAPAVGDSARVGGRGKTGRSWPHRLMIATTRLDTPRIAIAAVCKLVGDLAGFVGPLAIVGMVEFVTKRARGEEDRRLGGMELGYWWLLAAAVSAFVQNLLLQHHHILVIHAAIRIRSAITLLVYRKALRVDAATQSAVGVGKIQTMQSVDASAIHMLYYYVHYAWAAPLQIAITMAMLYDLLGPSCFVGLAVLILIVPVQSCLATRISKYTKDTYRFTDERIKLVNEAVQGIRILKFFAFEQKFIDRIAAARNEELYHKRKSLIVNAVNVAILNIGPLLVALLTFLTFGYTSDQGLTPAIAFSSLTLFTILRLPLTIIPSLVSAAANARVSFHRVGEFLELAEMQECRTIVEVPDTQQPCVQLVNATLHWNAKSPPAQESTAVAAAEAVSKSRAAPTAGDALPPKIVVADAPASDAAAAATGVDEPSRSYFALHDLNICFAPGKLTQIVGAVGAGKSSLLSALLGEMTLEAGSIEVRVPQRAMAHPMAYCAQQAWILNATVRNNILFGNDYDEARYNHVLHACALLPDLAILPAGDATEIGEKGINLSGGQKARISLARALYSTAPIVLLDDILSAVDAHVARHLFRHAILQGFRDRTVLLVTHQLQFLSAGDRVVVMHAGRITQHGTYAECMAHADDASTPNLLALMVQQRQRVNDSLSAATTAQTEVGEGAGEPSSLTEVGAGTGVLADAHTNAAVPGSGAFAPSVATPNSPQARVDAVQTGAAATMMAASPNDADTASSATVVADAAAADFAAGTPTDAEAIELGLAASPIAADPADKAASVEAAEEAKKDAAAADAHRVAAGKLIHEEDRLRGTVPTRVYWDYLVAFTYFLLIVLLVSLVLLNAGTVGMDFWLSHWSDNDGRYTLGYFVGIYGAITAATSVVTLVHQLCWAYGGTIASRLLHHDMLARVLRSPISFFDATPVGRILNRFSGDVDTVDKMLPSTFQNLMSLSTRIVSTFIVQAIVFPFILISMLPLALIYFFIQSFYRHSSRELKRLDSITKSPVYATLSECLSGVSTLRAFQAFRRFDVSLQVHINRNASVFLRLNLINRWMGLRLDWLGSLLVAVTCLITVLTAGKVEPGLVGLALSYSFSITSLLNWLVRSATETETNLSCVERIETYSKLVTERPPIVDACRPPREWPSAGAIEFRNLMLRYRPDLPPVLQGVNISIAPGEKVGICGRTGSGKSSLMLGLFRMLEAQEGSIHIDGINIADIGLDDLRERLAIIPQDPVLFNGTLRYNLDPTHTFNEESMWQALESVQMAAYVRAQSDGLDMHITDGGGNLSTGQRQLLCMARSLMRDARVLVLDEATASTDVNSDAIIQRRLRELHGVTQLTIAHRIDTILDSDKILVLEAGRVLEFAPPAQLLADPNSAFAKLVRQSAAHSASTH